MKKILFTVLATFCLLGFFNEAQASHAAGGDITYVYKGPNPNGPGYEYCITLTLYKDESPFTAGFGNSYTVDINSTCFGSSSVTVTADSMGVVPRGYKNCVDPNDGIDIGGYYYSGCVILPGQCSDFRFSFDICCRNSAITNLQNPSSKSLYLEATLNNTLGQNTSGHFLNPAAKAFCVNKPFTWSHAAIEPDGDSIYYRLGQPLDAFNAPIQYAAGYSISQPMSTIGGFNMNNATGTLTFTPSNVEVDVIQVLVDEYRQHPSFGWLRIGTAIRELQVPVVATCNALAQSGITIDTNITGTGGIRVPSTTISTDSLRGAYNIGAIGNDSTFVPGQGWVVTLPGVPYPCYDSVVTLQFSNKLKCSTFSPDGSEFRIVGPDSMLRPVVAVNTHCGTDELTDKVDLILHKALDINGNFLLYLKTGNDQDVLENECGFGINPFFSMLIVVNDCPILDYEMLNVSVERDIDIRVDWEADPTSFSERLFNTWRILRANNDDQFYPLDTVNNVFARTYLDTSLEDYDVDGAQFQYAIQLIQNFEAQAPTNTIRSILLTGETNNDTTGTNLEWTLYDGWDSAAYELEIGKFDTVLGSLVWENYEGPMENFLSSSFTWPNPVTEQNEGLYAFRVKATEPHNANNPFVSESNWIYLEFEVPPVDPIPNVTTGIIPNVFTPNGDAMNDQFLLPTNSYSSVSISVYNRWGKLVYQHMNAPKEAYHPGSKGWDGTDMNSGNKLADGTYFYVLEFSDELSGKSEEVKGHVNIFTAGTK